MDTAEPSEFRLVFRTDDQLLRKLAEGYWASQRGVNGRLEFTRNVADLATQFGLRKSDVTGAVRAAANAFRGRCPVCQTEKEYPHRYAFESGQKLFTPERPCADCRIRIERDASAARRRAIRREFPVRLYDIDTKRLSLRDAVYAAALLRAKGSPESRRIGPVESGGIRITPIRTYDVKVVLPSAQPAWITGIDIPDARTRLKTWPFKP